MPGPAARLPPCSACVARTVREPNVDLVALVHLRHRFESLASHETPEARGHDDLHGAVEPHERTQVEVVVVGV